MAGPRRPVLSFRDGRWWLAGPRPGAALNLGPLLPALRWMVGPLRRMAGMSKRSFERAVAAALGIGAKEWLRMERMVAATRLLRGEVPLKRVASDLGFRHPGAFSREFRKWFGVAPGVWRERAGRVRGDPDAG